MKACILHAIGDLRCEETAKPVPGPGEALVRIEACGICGSDVQRVFQKGTYRFPLIVGHELAGVVEEVGEGCDPVWLGRRAAVFPLLPCFACAACESGLYAQCDSYDYYGSRRDGGFAEYLAVKAFNLVAVPDGVSAEEAAMAEPAAVAVHALALAKLSLGESVLIYGAGTIGLMLAKLARHAGAGRVMLADIDPGKLRFARSLGFSDTINSAETDVAKAVAGLTGGRGAQVVIEGTGAAPALENAMNTAAVFGRVVLMGNPLGEMTLSQQAYWKILRRQLSLQGTWNSSYSGLRDDWAIAVNAMPALKLGELITHRFPLEDCKQAFEALRNREETAVKVMFINREIMKKHI